MCGLVLTTNSNVSNNIKNIIKSIERRGPDFNNYIVKDNILFCHTRLIFFDLSNSSNQPILINNETVILFNGEIFNYREFGDYKSDTLFLKDFFKKNIINKKNLIRFLNKLNGFFSIIIYKDGLVYSIRDRFGEKPMFITNFLNEIYYSSEIFSFKDQINMEVDSDFLKKYSLNPFLKRKPNESLLQTTYKNTHEQKPGSVIVYSIKKKKYIENFDWYNLKHDIDKYRDSDLFELIKSSIKLRLKSDVKGCIALSGGVDSSLIALVTNNITDKKIDSYSYISSNLIYDESSVIESLKNRLNKIKFNFIDEKFDLSADKLINSLLILNQPYFDSNNAQIEFYKKIEKKNKFIIEGHGADELFLGYNFHISILFWVSIFRFRFREALNSIICFFNSFIHGYPLKYKILTLFNSLYVLIKSKKGLIFSQKFSSFKMILFESFFKTILPKLLNNYDKVTMHNSIESRSPYLDFRVVANVLSKDISFFISKNSKIFLRKQLSNFNINIPNEKKGFRSYIWNNINKKEKDKLFYIFNKSNFQFFNKKKLSTKKLDKLITDYKFEIYFWKVISYYSYSKLFKQFDYKR